MAGTCPSSITTPRGGGLIPPRGPEWDTTGVTLLPVLVGTGTADEDGRLVFHGGKMVAVLVRLSDEHEDMAGQWFLEHGFGPLDDTWYPTFDGLDPACVWIARRLGRERAASV